MIQAQGSAPGWFTTDQGGIKWKQLGQVPGRREVCESGVTPHQGHCALSGPCSFQCPHPTYPLPTAPSPAAGRKPRHPVLPTQQGAPQTLAPPPGSYSCTSEVWSLQCLARVKTKGEEGAKQRNSSRRSWSWSPSLAAPQLALPWKPESREQKVPILRRHGPCWLCLPAVPCAGDLRWAPEETPRHG